MPSKVHEHSLFQFLGQFSNFLTPHINSELSDSFCIGELELVAFFEKSYQKIGSNFSREKLERVVIYPAWQLFFIIIFTAVVIFTYILLSRATYPSLMLVVLCRDLISVLGSRL